jgi:hypothetical protein
MPNYHLEPISPGGLEASMWVFSVMTGLATGLRVGLLFNPIG